MKTIGDQSKPIHLFPIDYAPIGSTPILPDPTPLHGAVSTKLNSYQRILKANPDNDTKTMPAHTQNNKNINIICKYYYNIVNYEPNIQ